MTYAWPSKDSKMKNLLVSCFTLLLFSSLLYAQEPGNSVVESSLVPPHKTVNKSTSSLLGDQLNRIAPSPVDHNLFNDDQHHRLNGISANFSAYPSPTNRLPMVGVVRSASPETSINQFAASYSAPVGCGNLPAYRPNYGCDCCYNVARVVRWRRCALFFRIAR